jgi:hemolysin D
MASGLASILADGACRAAIRIDGGMVDLRPGMAVTVEISTGRRRVIDYLLSPLLRYGQESLRER